jgi:hypothetical protein
LGLSSHPKATAALSIDLRPLFSDPNAATRSARACGSSGGSGSSMIFVSAAMAELKRDASPLNIWHTDSRDKTVLSPVNQERTYSYPRPALL